jgi:hypothetical protein
MLFQQRDAVHGHAAVHGFAHVVNGQQGHLHGREGFIQINNLRSFLESLAPFLQVDRANHWSRSGAELATNRGRGWHGQAPYPGGV